jgi:hypothetical protein
MLSKLSMSPEHFIHGCVSLGTMRLGRVPAPILVVVVLAMTLCSVDYPRAAAAQAFLESFDGAPAIPTPWHPSNWDVTVHSRDVPTFSSLQTMHAGHGTDCSGPPATHDISSYEDAVFLCRDHLMTAIKAEGYGVIYLTPNAMVDFSAGEAVVRFDISTERTSLRDWIDVWVTPFDENVQLVGDIGAVDLNGLPRRAVQIRMDESNGATVFRGDVIRNFNAQEVGSNDLLTLPSVLTPSAAVRTTFEMRISRTHLKFGIPALDAWWVNDTFADLGWSTGVLQIGHHSYNPEKDCSGCTANTWHWDNVSISPALPFTILNADRRYASAETPAPVTFAAAAPANAFQRFAGIGNGLAVSYDGGSNWQTPRLQSFEQLLGDEHFRSYWTPVPEGTRSVQFKGSSWFGGPWRARDIGIWGTSLTSGTATFPPSTSPPTTAPPIGSTPPPSPTAPPPGGGGGTGPVPTPAPTRPPVAVVVPASAMSFGGTWMSQSTYPVLEPGATGLVTLRFANTGSETWQVGVPGKQMNIGVIGDSTEFADLGMTAGWLSANRPATTLERTVAPGGVGTFSFVVRAPATPGVYRVDLGLVVDGVRWLDDQGVYVIVTSDQGLHSQWLSQTPWPVVRAGERTGQITVVYRNSGTQAWVSGSRDHQVNLGIAGDDVSWGPFGIGWTGPNRPAVQREAVVTPGDLGSFVFELRAPDAPGTYVLSLRLVVDGVAWLDDGGVFIQITVLP